jgi:hypothetical protein
MTITSRVWLRSFVLFGAVSLVACGSPAPVPGDGGTGDGGTQPATHSISGSVTLDFEAESPAAPDEHQMELGRSCRAVRGRGTV